MNLSMSLSLGMTQKMEQQIRLSAEQRMTLRHELALKMRETLELVQSDAGLDPPSRLDDVLQAVIACIRDEKIRTAILAIFTNQHLRNRMFRQATTHAIGRNMADVQAISCNALLDGFNGEAPVVEEDGTSSEIKIINRRVIDALNDPAKVQQDIEESRKLMDTAKEAVGEGAFIELDELMNGANIAELIRDPVALQNQLLTLAFCAKEPGAAETVLRNYFREVVIFEQLAFVVSERIQNRFATRFADISKRDTEETLQCAMMNTVGEFTLASMGVIQPELFVAQSGEMADTTYEDAKSCLQENGISLDELMRRFNLTKEGKFFWSRWAVKGEKKAAVTDDKVRAFLNVIRAESDEVLAALDFNTLIAEVRAAKQASEQIKSIESRKVLLETLREILYTHMSSDAFKKVIVAKIKGTWYKQLSIFTALQ